MGREEKRERERGKAVLRKGERLSRGGQFWSNLQVQQAVDATSRAMCGQAGAPVSGSAGAGNVKSVSISIVYFSQLIVQRWSLSLWQIVIVKVQGFAERDFFFRWLPPAFTS